MTSDMAFSEEWIPKDMFYDEIGLCGQFILISVHLVPTLILKLENNICNL